MMGLPKAIATEDTANNKGVDDIDSNGALSSENYEGEDEEYSMSLSLNRKSKTLAQKETRAVQFLRLLFLAVLILTGVIVSTSVYLVTRHQEQELFATATFGAAVQVVDKFHVLLEQSLVGASSLSATMTSYANRNNQSFPFVTLPEFELLASHLRTSSGSHIVLWMPFVTDQQRGDWEDYAMEKRFHIDESFQKDSRYRELQDAEFEVVKDVPTNANGTAVPPPPAVEHPNTTELTVLDDGTGYHPKIYSQQGTAHDEPEGAGPFMVNWQRSPINPAKQKTLNVNWARLPILATDIMNTISQEKKAIINSASVPPSDYFKAGQEKNLQLSQYRENTQELIDGPSTYITYPVFDSLDQESREVKGVIHTSIYWKVLFSNLLPSDAPKGLICVVQNSFGQYFSFRLDGPHATWIGFGDAHDPQFDEYEYTADITEYLASKAGPRNQAYTSVLFSDSVQYTIRVFPSDETQSQFFTQTPFNYMISFAAAFVFAAILFALFTYVVERRQTVMMKKVIFNARRAASAERELNEFLSHEVRNPLSVAITACSFATSALMKDNLGDATVRKDVCEDLEVVNQSLSFINDFLRSMLDTHRASVRKLKVHMAPTDILRDVLQPVSNLINVRGVAFEVIVECPQDLVVMSDCIRLKQVILNLARNATKFVEKGYIRLRAEVDGVSNRCRLLVEDSGCGIPVEKRNRIFGKYQESLDQLHQGVGVGLHLSEKLINIMNGDIWLDDTYHSTVEGCPGCRFVVELNVSPMDIEKSPLLLKNEACDDPYEVVDADGTVPGVRFTDTSHKIIMPQAATPEDLEQGLTQSTAASPSLPPAIPPPQPPPAPTESGPELSKDLSVLFVDDDAILRKLFVRSVRRVEPSWQIKEAACGEIALEFCGSETFDLIFMDQYMASINKQLLGTETIERLRAQGVTSVICGLSANSIRGEFIKAGADDFNLKPLPCKPEALKLLLRTLISGREQSLD